MAEQNISNETLLNEIKRILKGADLTKLSSKAVRKSLEESLDVDLTDRKKEIDAILMDLVAKNASSQGESKSQSGDEEDAESMDDSDEADNDEMVAKRLQEEESLPRRSKASSKKAKQTGGRGKRKKEDDDGAGVKVKKSNSAYSRPCTLSADLAEVVGAKEMPRHSVVKRMWEIARERNLFDPTNKRYIICDDQLFKMFGTKRILMFGIMKHLKTHIKDQKNLA